MDILRILEDDHRRFLELLASIDEEIVGIGRPAFGEADGRPRAAAQLGELEASLRRHSAWERTLLVPRIVARAPKSGPQLHASALEDLDLEGLVAEFLAGLSNGSGKPPSWAVTELLRLTQMLRRHIELEETGLFRVARAALSAQELERIGSEARA